MACMRERQFRRPGRGARPSFYSDADKARGLLVESEDLGVYRQRDIVFCVRREVGAGAEDSLVFEVDDVIIAVGAGLQAKRPGESLAQDDLQQVVKNKHVENPIAELIIVPLKAWCQNVEDLGALGIV